MQAIDYTGDPRAVLIHEGNRNSGRYPRGSGDRPYQHVAFGRAKYVKEDGTLTEEGRARWEYDKRKNATKKKEDKVKDEDLEKLIDPHRWVNEDLDALQKGIQNAQGFTRSLTDYERKRIENRPKVRKKKLDLSNMTDAELRAQIDRYVLEQRYLDTFDPLVQPEISKGKKWLMNTLEVAGSALAVGVSAVTIAKAMNDMKKGQ